MTRTIEEYPCGCEYWTADDAGVWFPCERAKANGLDFCPVEEMFTDSKWRDEC